MEYSNLKIRGLRARPVNVPMQRPLYTSGGAVEIAPLVLLDLETEEGVTGRSYIFTYTSRALKPMVALLDELVEFIKGDTLAPVDIEAKFQRTFRLLGTPGLTGMAIAGIDIAAWDALARAAQLPLVRLLGGEPRPIPAYNSNGLGIIGPEKAYQEAAELVEPGFKAVKVRLGYPDIATDVAVVRAVREAVPDDTVLMSDYNQVLSVAEAMRRIKYLDDEDLYWVEEPTRADDYEGYAQIRSKARTPIQLGENCWGPHDVAKALAAGAGDFYMPDLVKIGGVTGWLRAASLAEPGGFPISCHLFPEVSAHLLAVTPTSHYLEYVDWATPILQEPLELRDGQAIISDEPGNGLAWDEDKVAKYLA